MTLVDCVHYYKYTVPVAATAIGSSYNYVTTRSVGRIARVHLKNRGKVTDELRVLVSRQNTYDIAFPAAAMYMAQVDGQYSTKEREFYRALLSRMSFDEHTEAEFRRLVDTEDNLLGALATIEDAEIRGSLVEALILMAVYDGELGEEESRFLVTTAEHLNVPLDLDDVERRSLDYRIVVEDSVFRKTVTAVRDVSSRAMGVAGQAAGSVKVGAAAATAKAGGALGKLRERIKPAQEEVACVNCGATVPVEYAFCPKCGQALSMEKHCVSCGEVIPVDFAFCPHCGVSQG